MGMFDRFTDRAREAVSKAKELAADRNDDAVGPEHLFVSIVNKGLAYHVLKNFDFDLPNLQKRFKETEFRMDRSGTKKLFSEKALEVFEQMERIANEINHNYRGDEHLLLALLFVDSPVRAFLNLKGIDYAMILEEVLSLLGHGSELELEGKRPSVRVEIPKTSSAELPKMDDLGIEIYIDPGQAKKETLQEVLECLSDLHIAAGGFGLEFIADDLHIHLMEGAVK